MRPTFFHFFAATTVAGLLTLTGCALGPGSGSGSSRTPTVSEEHRRLRSELSDALSRIAINTTSDGQLRVEVPLRYSFDAGRAAVKPPLAAVLDHMATGLVKMNGAEIRVAAPSDPRGGALLATDRAASARDYLVAKGVPVTRFTSVSRAESESVEISVSERRR